MGKNRELRNKNVSANKMSDEIRKEIIKNSYPLKELKIFCIIVSSGFWMIITIIASTLKDYEKAIAIVAVIGMFGTLVYHYKKRTKNWEKKIYGS